MLDESANPFGSGWSLEHLTTATGGADRTLWFSSGGSGGGYTSPAGDFSTLASSSGGSGGTTYSRTLPDGTGHLVNEFGVGCPIDHHADVVPEDGSEDQINVE